MRISAQFTSRLTAALVVAIASISHPAAQQPARPATTAPATTTAPPAGGQAADAPVVRFAADGISIEEAVRLTLQHDPNIRRRQAGVQFQEGLAQSQGGPFDPTWLTSLDYSHRIQELTESRKQNERDKRTRLDDFISGNQASVAQAQTLIPLLDRLRTAAPGQEPINEIRAIDPAMADLLLLFNNLISATTDATIRQNLITARADFINRTIGTDFAAGLQDQISNFASVKTQRLNLGDAPDDEVFQNAGVNFQFSKLFRSGIQFAPFFDGSRDSTNFKGKADEEEFGGKGLKDQYLFHAGAAVNFPLLRGRGIAVAGAERAAYIERDASRLSAQHEASVSALNTMLAYWDVRGAQETVEIVKRSVELQANLLRLTQQLIEAGELPRAELARSQAGEARVRAQFDDAQRQLHQARIALASAMGVAATSEDATLPLAKDGFPATPAALPDPASLVAPSSARRLDLSAAMKDQEAGRVLVDAATANLKPRLDLSTSTFYTALGESSLNRSVSRWVGPSTELSLQLERPWGNNLFKGQLLSQQADVKSRDITAADLQRQIRLGVLQASATLPETISQVRQAEAAVGFARSIYEADIERYRTGDATLLDTVITEQQQTEAMLTLISARNQLARLIAQLRFQTGTLVAADGSIAPTNFVTIPGRN